MPTYLEGFGYFADRIALETAQQALLGEITAAGDGGPVGGVPERGIRQVTRPAASERRPTHDASVPRSDSGGRISAGTLPRAYAVEPWLYLGAGAAS